MFFRGIGVPLVLMGLAGMAAGSVSTGLLLFIGGFALMAINKLVFKARRVQREIDANEAVKRLERRVEYLEKKKESGN